MFRKHTRRAAKAAFAISFGVALLIGLTACGGAEAEAASTTRRPLRQGRSRRSLLGTKNFAEELHPRPALRAGAGRRRASRSPTRATSAARRSTDTAIKSGKINLYPEYTGVIALDLAKVKNAPEVGDAIPTRSQRSSSNRSAVLTLLNPTPFDDSDTFTVLTSTANEGRPEDDE